MDRARFTSRHGTNAFVGFMDALHRKRAHEAISSGSVVLNGSTLQLMDESDKNRRNSGNRMR